MEHHRDHRRRSQDGFTLVEMMMGAIVFLIAAVVMGNHLTQNFRTTKNQRDRVFAYTKAQAILSEIHSLVDRGDVEAAIDLDRYDDGVETRPTLSIETDTAGVLIPANDPISGNIQREGQWVWSRQISVRPFAGMNNRNMRYVTIRIFKSDQYGNTDEMASLSSVVNSVASSFPATQVFDVYLLAIDTIPGWWVYMEAIVPFVESAVTDLEARNPGLSVRTHWITKSGFGRNDVYKPLINDDVDSREPVRGVYFYPGKMPDGSSSTYYYVPDIIKGRLNIDGVDANIYDSQTNPYPYSVADYFNHAMREPQARRLHELRVEAVERRAQEIREAERNGTAAPPELVDMSVEQPLQLLLNDMIADPDRYRNAILVNLHGELLPTPPLRNYSDPAKCPEAMPYVRVVTHPEELRTQAPPGPAGTEEDVRFRVYSYLTNPDTARWLDRMPNQHPIILEVPNMNLCVGQSAGYLHPDVEIDRLPGGVPTGLLGDAKYRPFEPAPMYFDAAPLDPFSQEQMSYYAFYDAGGGVEEPKTVIYLFHTPVVCDAVDSRGLNNNQRSRLYGLQYVPSPTGTTNDFQHDLYALGDGPKNTARWRLTIPSESWANRWFTDMTDPYGGFDPRDRGDSDVVVTARTRIYDNTAGYSAFLNGQVPGGTQPYFLQPENNSETYTWWAQTADAVPPVERYQIMGDPRHVPYKDCGHGDPDFPDAYNWFFDSLRNGADARADFPGIERGWNRYNGGPHFDVPRLMQLFREALVSCNAIYTTLSGYSYYYVGVGNEIGYDSANGYSNSIPVSRYPFGGSEFSTGYANNITGTREWIRNQGSDYWWGMNWLGELSPDWAYSSDWFLLDVDQRPKGNLPCGPAWNNFERNNHDSTHSGNGRWRAYGTALSGADHRTNSRGCVSFFNNGNGSSHFNHHFSSGNGQITGPGYDLRDNYGFPIPDQIATTRPFTVNTGGNLPPEFNVTPYSTERYSASVLRTFYSFSSGRTSSGLVQLQSPDGSNAAWIVVNGLAQTTTTGSAFLSKYCLLSMYQSFFELGDQGLTHRIQQPPRLEITDPTEISEIVNPSSIDVRIEVDWLRWDRLPYTSSTPSSFAESESDLEYAIYYSKDNGYSWYHAQDDTPAVIGQRPDASYLVPDAGTGDQTYTWTTPTSDFPEGSYVIRVEAYRRNVYLHYSVHQVKIYLQR